MNIYFSYKKKNFGPTIFARRIGMNLGLPVQRSPQDKVMLITIQYSAVHRIK